MQSLKPKHVTNANSKSPVLLFHFLDLFLNNNNNNTHINISSSSSYLSSPIKPHCYSSLTQLNNYSNSTISAKRVVLSFKEWFNTRNNALFDRIFRILSQKDVDDAATHIELSRLGLRLSESQVLEVLSYGNRNKEDVLSCIKFFDWAGRQHNFKHTRVTFNAIFKILSKAKLMSLMLDFLQNYAKDRSYHKVRFYDTLVMGYAVAGKLDLALHLFGRMRFQGLDLDAFAYHVLLNALVEETCFDAVEVVAKQISLRGFESHVTRSILTKSLCKQNRLDEAEDYLRGLVSAGLLVGGHAVSVLVDALCKRYKFQHAARLVEEFRHSNVGSMELAYGIWLRDLVQSGKVDEAMQFLKSKKSLEGYVPDVFRYNVLVYRLLRENRLEEVFDLLMEMKEGQISPDKVTMNAALCLFCKAGMLNIALELYNSRSEFDLSLNSMAYNYLINTLCGDGSTDEAYRVLKNSIDQGFFPRKKTISILADALCSEGKLDKMKELLIVALERNCLPSDLIYDKFISALCRARRIEDAYLIHGELNKVNGAISKSNYSNLIRGFNRSFRGDIAARLLIEMQEKGHAPTRILFRAVIRCLFEMENPEKQFLTLLEMQLSHHGSNPHVYNFFIDGAGHAKKPEFAREVYEMMQRNGFKPHLISDILMLQSYLKSDKISDALNFFGQLEQRGRIGTKLYNTMIVGLCKAKRAGYALSFLKKMRDEGVVPSNECYEDLIKLLCSGGEFETVMKLIDDLEIVKRPITSFIGNVLLLHSLKSKELYKAWIQFREVDKEPSKISLLGQLIGVFSGCIKANPNIDDLEEVIKRCFPLDIYTYNILLRKLSMSEINEASELFTRIYQKGYEPNQWTYEILVHGLFKHGRRDEARRRLEEMFEKGFDPTEQVKLLI